MSMQTNPETPSGTAPPVGRGCHHAALREWLVKDSFGWHGLSF